MPESSHQAPFSPHLVVVGGGIVGLSCCHAAQRRGWRVTLIDRDFAGDRASHGNAGSIAVAECLPLSLTGLGLKPLKWLLDPLGPLAIRPAHAPRLWPWYRALRRVGQGQNLARIGDALAALNRRALGDLQTLFADLGLHDALHPHGALTVYETTQAFVQSQAGWQFKRERGVRWRNVDAEELRTLEPGLAPVFRHAVMVPDCAHVDDPRHIVETLRARVQEQGAQLLTGEALRLQPVSGTRASVQLGDGRHIVGDKVLVCAGAWSARLARTLGERVLLESERGYNTTLPASRACLTREVIFAERMFVATPLSVGLRIGGTAEFAGLQAPANYQRSTALLTLARRYFPQLNEDGAKAWMGQRPTTPDSLPVIGASSKHPGVLYAFGHGHLGLTQAATTAELIGDLLQQRPAAIDLTPYSIARF